MSGADREVLPVRQDMNRDKIDRVIDFPIAKPIFPHIGIGDGNRDLRLDRPDVGGEIGRGHLSAQQVFQAVAAEPDPLDDFQSHFGGQRWNLIEAVFDRIGAHAIGYFGELRQILRDLFRCDMSSQHERRLGVAERRIGHAQQLGVGIDRRARQIDRGGQPPPDGSDRTQGYQEKRQWRTKRNRFHPPGRDRRLAGHQPSAKSRMRLSPLRLYHSMIKL